MRLGADEIDAVNMNWAGLRTLLAVQATGGAHLLQIVPWSCRGDHALETRQHDVVEEATNFCRRLANANRRADLRAVTAIAGSKLHNNDIDLFEHAAGRTRVTEDHRRIFHRRRADDCEIDVAATFEDGTGCGGFELVFGDARTTPVRQRSQRILAELARLTDALKLLVAFFVNQLMHETRLESKSCIGKGCSERVILVDRKIIVKARINFQNTDLAAL